jgi:GNAT superfamily N-acetyltransferase
MNVRVANASDAECLALQLRDYLDEGYPGHAGSTAVELRRDVLTLGARHHVLLVVLRGTPVGFLAWDEVYDMPWAAAGAQIADVYVAPPARGHGAALLLITRACSESRALGGRFLRGGAYERGSTRRFYARVAVVAPSGDTHLSGRAFRQLAGLGDYPIRQLLRSLPPVEWNYEA